MSAFLRTMGHVVGCLGTAVAVVQAFYRMYPSLTTLPLGPIRCWETRPGLGRPGRRGKMGPLEPRA